MSSKYSVELFLEACGATGPLHLGVEDSSRPGGPLRRVLHQPFVVIGRDPTTDLLLASRRVSRRHAYLQLVGGRLFCVDLGSRTGTEWDDGSFDSGWLESTRFIRVGPYVINLWDDANRFAAVEAPDDFSAGFTIEFLTQASAQPPVRVAQDLALVGSSEECRVRIPHSDVSKAHCSFVRSPRGVWVVDLLGRGGVFVNETHIRFARVDDGDAVRIGRHILRIRLDDYFVDLANETNLPARLPGRRSSIEPTPRTDRNLPVLPEPPSASVPLIATWSYPENEVHRVVNERQSTQAEMIQALMQPLVQQFGVMQQQMFEQFHQAMSAMFQSFGGFYRDQMADLRDELEEVRRLTAELHALKAEAEGRRDEAAAISAPVPLPLPPPYVGPPPYSGAAVVAPPKPPTSAPRPTKPDPEPRSIPRTAAASTSKPADEPAPRRLPPTKTDVGVHTLLTSRIAALQTERQTRWQKILGMLNRTPG